MRFIGKGCCRPTRSTFALAEVTIMSNSTTPNSQTPNSKPWSESLNALAFPLHRLKAERSRRSLRTFIEAAWPMVESVPFVPGWHIDAIAEHLEAVTRGQIRNLLITIPPLAVQIGRAHV